MKQYYVQEGEGKDINMQQLQNGIFSLKYHRMGKQEDAFNH